MKKILILTITTSLVTSFTINSTRLQRNTCKTSLNLNLFDKMFSNKSNSKTTSSSIITPNMKDTALSWEELNTKLRNIEPPEERIEFDSIATGRSRANHKANIRLFDAPEGTIPEVTLYRDTAGWCPYCEVIMLNSTLISRTKR